MEDQPQKKLFGDWLAEVTTKLGIKSCIPCKARQAKMNNLHMSIAEKLRQVFSSQS